MDNIFKRVPSDYVGADGIVDMDQLALDDSFNYKVVVTKGDTVITSTSKKVTVKAAISGTAAIESTNIFLAPQEDEIDGNEVEIKSGTLTVDDEAYLRVRGTDADDFYGSITTQAKYSSSDPSIAYVDS